MVCEKVKDLNTENPILQNEVSMIHNRERHKYERKRK